MPSTPTYTWQLRTRSAHSRAAGLIGGRKVEPCPRSRARPPEIAPLHCGHIRRPFREVPQLGGAPDEHPPPGIITRTSQPHPTLPQVSTSTEGHAQAKAPLLSSYRVADPAKNLPSRTRKDGHTSPSAGTQHLPAGQRLVCFFPGQGHQLDMLRSVARRHPMSHWQHSATVRGVQGKQARSATLKWNSSVSHFLCPLDFRPRFSPRAHCRCSHPRCRGNDRFSTGPAGGHRRKHDVRPVQAGLSALGARHRRHAA